MTKKLADLREADLSNADLQHADIREARLREANLRGANLRGAKLNSEYLHYSYLCGADLSEADLRYSDLRYSDLRYSDLRYSDLSNIKGEKEMTTYFISRHDGAIEWASRKGFQNAQMVAHFDPKTVKMGDMVLGTLPVHIAEEVCRRGGKYYHLILDLPAEARGRELTADNMIEYGARLVPYSIREDISAENESEPLEKITDPDFTDEFSSMKDRTTIVERRL